LRWVLRRGQATLKVIRMNIFQSSPEKTKGSTNEVFPHTPWGGGHKHGDWLGKKTRVCIIIQK
jgi:hypothetical protein